MRVLTNILIFIAVIATALPFVRTTHWWIRIFDYPRAQIAFIAVLALILTFYEYRKEIFRMAGIALILLSAIVYQASLIIKYTPLFPITSPGSFEPKPENTFTILMYNVRMENKEYEKFKTLAAQIDPEIILLTEPDINWEREIAISKENYPYQILYPLDNTYGMLLFSKLELVDPEVNFLVKEDIPSMYAKVKLLSGITINLHALHPEPPKPGSPTYDRDTEILLVGQRIVNESGPSVVAGDLNDVAWSSTSELFQKSADVLDPREGRGLFNTYSVNFPLFRYPLDHFFYTYDFNLVDLRRLDNIGSDHFPILITLEFVPKEEMVEK
ncbi:MAG TPA: endonuclease/exonuclease/phosphatase family protein [Anditalea sp.]|nr:endonuclease/exonuclease/phosphatase family protein [Anditalea sp.]